MMTYPIELNLAGRTVLMVGGGEVAARKVAGLIQAGARVRVVSPGFLSELMNCAGVTLEARPYAADCLDGVALVFACTDDRSVNAAIAADCREKGIWCNIADEAEACDFLVPAVARQGGLTLAIGTGAAAPLLAGLLRDRLSSHLRPEWSILIEELGRARALLKAQVEDRGIRRKIMETLCTDCSLKLLATHDREAWRRWFERVTESRLNGMESAPEPPDTL